MKTLMRRWCLIVLAFAIFACSAQNGGSSALQTGMTNDQAIAAMGQPDLKDEVPDPNHPSAQLYRYSWLSAGQAAVFGTDNHVMSIQNIASSTATPQRKRRRNSRPHSIPFRPRSITPSIRSARRSFISPQD